MSTTIKYTAVLDDNPFAAGTKRVGELLEGMKQRFTSVGGSVAGTGQAISGHMRQIAGSVSQEVSSMGGHFSGLLGSLANTKAGLIGLVVAGAGLAASKAVESTAKWTEESMDLARVLGSSTNVASQWKVALADVGATQEELQGAAKGLSKQIKENEDGLKAMGLVTRDASGQLRPLNDLMVEAIAITNSYKGGADRAMAAQELFGRGVDASSKLLLVQKQTLEEARLKMQALGLETGERATAAWKEFDAAGDDAALTMQGLGNTVGRMVMPVFTDLTRMFAAAMPTAIKVVKVALGGLVSVFHGLKTVVSIVWETINAMVVTVAEPIRALAEALGKAVTGDFAGAAAAIKGIGSTISGAWRQAMNEMADSADRSATRIRDIWNDDVKPGKPEGEDGDKGFTPKAKKEKKEKAATDPSFMQYYEAALAEEKRLAAEKDALREYSKEQELAYWRTLLESADLVGKDRVAITKKVADIELQILRDQAKTRAALDQEALKLQQDRALGAVEIARQEAQGQYQLGEISYAQLLELERKYEEQSTEIKRQGLLDKLALIDPERDPVAYAQTSAQIEQLQREHMARLKQINLEQQLEAKDNPITRMFQGAQQSMQAAIEGMLQGQMSLKQGITAIWAGIRGAIVKEIAAIIAKKVAGYAIEKAMALAGIGANTAKAASGAAASQASIPYVGPALALAAMAAMFAAVGGMASKVPSAARGWDIPAGVNPLTQLHEQEMVLPAEHANAIRAMTASGGSSRPIELKAIPMPGNFFMMHRDALTSALQELRRDGSISLS